MGIGPEKGEVFFLKKEAKTFIQYGA